jgi:hypothetical protein
MKPADQEVPKALRDVWAWKQVVYREVQDLPISEALSAILDRAAEMSPLARPSRRQQRRRKPAAR